MQLTDLEARPRSAWEALDLGILLARRHAGRLMASWALVSLPVFALLSLLCWERPTLALLLFWWLKPLFERLPLYILSRALFGETPTLRGSLRALPGQLRPQWLASLTWRRFSPTRSFAQPVAQLEGLSGQALSRRLAVLGQRDSGTASWLTVVGVHLEMALWLGLLALLYLLLPQPLVDDWNWQALLDEGSDWLWLEHLSNLLYAVVLIAWEPVYVACGFSLYLNRRTWLEGWDIELGFRRLRQRLSGTAGLLLVALALLGGPAGEPVLAAGAPAARHEQADPLALTRQQARDEIATLLDQPPFENRKTVRRWLDDEQTAPDDWSFDNLDALLAGLARLMEALLWAALLALIGLLLWRWRQWYQLFGAWRPRPRVRREAPPLLFGLELAPESLPEDVAGSAERLWAEQPRQALSLLYRATLSHLLHDAGLPLRAAHTEGEVLHLTRALQRSDLTRFTEALTEHWCALAYGHQLPPDSARDVLCDGFRQLFARRGMPS